MRKAALQFGPNTLGSINVLRAENGNKLTEQTWTKLISSHPISSAQLCSVQFGADPDRNRIWASGLPSSCTARG